ncbi:DNA polymerase III subunit alpha [Pelagibacterium montanilacus]|uniref:DNA polymerase III subunit alpha n=1 Tax=Pelagibacterium montanilacus TaxID=2185280 RepID=UPI000F8E0E55|nr:DNA polymerase III subunit alpha [Pelagibacterium montanilacus]
MSGPGFIHLHIHSSYSLLEGALPLAKILDLAAKDGQPAIGIADTSNLFGALEFSSKASGKGIQPIIGCELVIDFELEEDKPSDRINLGKGTLVLIAADEKGFSNLSTLVSRAYLESGAGRPQALFRWLTEGAAEGIICLTGGPEGAIDPYLAAGLNVQAQARLDALHAVFGDRLYIELQRHGRPIEQSVEPRLVDLAYRLGIPLVATNEPYFPAGDDYDSHDALLAIASGSVVAQTERRRLSDQHYFKSRAEMMALFEDLPEAIENTVEIAQRVAFRPRELDPILPKFAAAADQTEEEAVFAEGEELARQAREGLAERINAYGLAPGRTPEEYADRLEHEIKIIRDMKFPGYFLIVADFIKWSKAKGIPVGPGRGSGAGSLVAYALTITDLDPLRYNLLFERFLNPERVSMPDFDIDFCQERREEVIRYVQNKYGEDQVAQIITFGTLQPRAALRDVGRVLQMPYGQVDRICKLVPNNPASPVTLAQAIDGEPRLQMMRDEDETVAELLRIAGKLEGLYRHASTHAAGIVIGDRPLHELLPLYRDPRSDMPVTQYNLKWVEPAGLVKFDFLGLKTLTTIRYAVEMVAKKGIEIDIDAIPLEDAETYKLYARGDTFGIFQFESPGMRRALVELKPDRIEDLIAMNALYRPGPMDNIPSFIDRKHGREKVTYPHEALRTVLDETYGIIVYQEQVMQIAQLLSGYSLGEADMLRRAMGKKIKAEMDTQRVRFQEGAERNGIKPALADTIFDLLAKFANYGFNKSHSAAYAWVSYQTGYLKTHHPTEFLAASMTLDMGNTDKLNDFKSEAERMGIEIVPPCINRSQADFSVHEGRILYSLCAVKGVGRQVAEHIVEVRGERPFADLADFARRIDPRIINKRTLDTLINAGAFDEMVRRREQVSAVADAIISTAQRETSGRADGIVDMFAGDQASTIVLPENVAFWDLTERLAREHSAIGFYLSAHPLDDYVTLFDRLRVQQWAMFEKAARNGAVAGRLAGTLVSRQDRKTRKGSTMAIMMFSDPSGSYECIAFSEEIESYGHLLEKGNSVILEVGADSRPDGVRLRLLKAEPLEKSVDRLGQRLTIFAADPRCLPSIRDQLKRGGDGVVSLVLTGHGGEREYEMELKGQFKITPQLAGMLKTVTGIEDVRLH